jgi:DMSO/TMAO reductase YedYZ molybdopterin-dependent catalytic subunit
MSMLTSATAIAALNRSFAYGRDLPALADAAVPGAAHDQTLVQYPEKTKLILLTDLPPQLETPLSYFRTDLTPNDAFFVRWHLSGIPTTVDLRTFRLKVSGRVRTPLSLSLEDLRTKFQPVSLVAVAQCAGNSRSFFEPRVPGGQWGNGAMGNAQWKGARLKDILDAAGVLPNAVDVGLRGLDQPPMAGTPAFEKSLHIDHARDGEVIVAYEMNGAPLPMLNGFPIRLVVAGWFATYWVKALSSITVLDQPLKTFWMDKAYRIPDNAAANEEPDHLSPVIVPISRMPVHSIFVSPEPGAQLQRRTMYTLSGVAMDGGSGIRLVEVSTDGGRSWTAATLSPDLGRYSWRRWQTQWTPSSDGRYRLMTRATTNNGDTQPLAQWNRSGYQRDIVEHVEVSVV